MRLVIFGLAVSSSWGNGHASLWRGLIRALHAAGHHVTFFERDVPYYAENRDLFALPGGGRLALYREWNETEARREADTADAAIVTSYCPDALAAARVIHESRAGIRCFYDLDTPVTLARLKAGERVDYIGPDGFSGFDIVLSYAGGPALPALRKLGAPRAMPLYGWVDSNVHRPGQPAPQYRAAMSYLGTYASDRQMALRRLLVRPAQMQPGLRFAIGGAQYPADFPWAPNIFFVRHLPVSEHPAFYASSRITLNVTRAAMAEMGWCPSGRLFEAAACAVPIATDDWPGLAEFFTPNEEILPVSSAADTLAVLQMDDAELRRIANRARERVLSQHTAARRAAEMVAAFQAARSPQLAETA